MIDCEGTHIKVDRFLRVTPTVVEVALRDVERIVLGTRSLYIFFERFC